MKLVKNKTNFFSQQLSRRSFYHSFSGNKNIFLPKKTVFSAFQNLCLKQKCNFFSDDDVNEKQEEGPFVKLVERNARLVDMEEEKIEDPLPNAGTNLELQPYIKDLSPIFDFKTTIEVKKHCKVTKSGRVFSFSSFVLIGNRDGAAGLGYGRGTTATDATKRALFEAQKNIITINRDGRRISSTRVLKYGGCKVLVMPMRRGENERVGSEIVQKVCDAFGIDSVSIRFLKKPRSKCKKTMLKALFAALEDVRTPQQVAAQIGRQSYDPDAIFRRKYYKYIY